MKILTKKQFAIIATSVALVATASVSIVFVNSDKVKVENTTTTTETTQVSTIESSTESVSVDETITESTSEKSVEEKTTKKNIENTTKNKTETTTKKKVETTTKKQHSYSIPKRVAPKANLTWEEAYHDNGDGTFTIRYVNGEVRLFVPHPQVKGKYTIYDEYYDYFKSWEEWTVEEAKAIWDNQWCEDCGRLTQDYGTGEEFCSQYIKGPYCHHCGERVESLTCHVCPNPCPHCGRKITHNHYRIAEEGINDCYSCDGGVQQNSCHICKG